MKSGLMFLSWFAPSRAGCRGCIAKLPTLQGSPSNRIISRAYLSCLIAIICFSLRKNVFLAVLRRGPPPDQGIGNGIPMSKDLVPPVRNGQR